MGNLRGESREQNRKDKVTRVRSVTCARQLGVLVNTLGSHLKVDCSLEVFVSFSLLPCVALHADLVFHAFNSMPSPSSAKQSQLSRLHECFWKGCRCCRVSRTKYFQVLGE